MQQSPATHTPSSFVAKIKRKRLYQIRNEFCETFRDEFHYIPSKSTIWRHLKTLKKKRMRLNIRTNVKKDPEKQLEYSTRISFVEASKIIDMDEIHFHPKDYLEKCGWATVGEEAYALQIIIFGKTCCSRCRLSRRLPCLANFRPQSNTQRCLYVYKGYTSTNIFWEYIFYSR